MDGVEVGGGGEGWFIVEAAAATAAAGSTEETHSREGGEMTLQSSQSNFAQAAAAALVGEGHSSQQVSLASARNSEHPTQKGNTCLSPPAPSKADSPVAFQNSGSKSADKRQLITPNICTPYTDSCLSLSEHVLQVY